MLIHIHVLRISQNKKQKIKRTQLTCVCNLTCLLHQWRRNWIYIAKGEAMKRIIGISFHLKQEAGSPAELVI